MFLLQIALKNKNIQLNKKYTIFCNLINCEIWLLQLAKENARRVSDLSVNISDMWKHHKTYFPTVARCCTCEGVEHQSEANAVFLLKVLCSAFLPPLLRLFLANSLRQLGPDGCIGDISTLTRL